MNTKYGLRWKRLSCDELVALRGQAGSELERELIEEELERR